MPREIPWFNDRSWWIIAYMKIRLWSQEWVRFPIVLTYLILFVKVFRQMPRKFHYTDSGCLLWGLSLPPPPMVQLALVGKVLISEVSYSHSDTPHLVGFLWTSDQFVSETSTWQQTTLTKADIHAFGGIRTRNPNYREAADPCLRSRDHWDRLWGP